KQGASMNKRSKPEPLEKIADVIRGNQSADIGGWPQEKIAALLKADGKVGLVPIGIIKIGENVRRQLDLGSPEHQQLIESVRQHGILQPPVVTVATNEHGVHQVLLVAGERRLHAAKAIGLTEIPCLVKIFDSVTTRVTAALA